MSWPGLVAESHWVDGLNFVPELFIFLGFMELVVVMALMCLLMVSRMMASMMLGGVLSLEEASWIPLGRISPVLLLVRIVGVLISPRGHIRDSVTVPPVGLSRVLRKESCAWEACNLVSLMTFVVMLVMSMMLLMSVSLLSERHWDVVVERKVCNVLFLIGKARILGIFPSFFAGVVEVRVVNLHSFGLGETL